VACVNRHCGRRADRLLHDAAPGIVGPVPIGRVLVDARHGLPVATVHPRPFRGRARHPQGPWENNKEEHPMLPAVRYDYYKIRLNRDVRSDAPIPRRQPSGLGDKRRSVGGGTESSNPSPSSGESTANLPPQWPRSNLRGNARSCRSGSRTSKSMPTRLERAYNVERDNGGRPSGGSRYFRQPCVGALASLPRQRCLLVTRRMRFTLG
jgi:hypothetical protein